MYKGQKCKFKLTENLVCPFMDSYGICEGHEIAPCLGEVPEHHQVEVYTYWTGDLVILNNNALGYKKGVFELPIKNSKK